MSRKTRKQQKHRLKIKEQKRREAAQRAKGIHSLRDALGVTYFDSYSLSDLPIGEEWKSGSPSMECLRKTIKDLRKGKVN